MSSAMGDGASAPSGEGPALSLSDAMELAIGLHQQGLLDAAGEIYEHVLAAEPEQADALHLLGLARHQQGRSGEALDLLQRAVAHAPTNVDARNNLGNVLLSGGRLDEAAAAYRQVLALRPGFAGAHANLGVALRRLRDAEGAEAAFRRALTLDPEHGGAYHNLGSLMRDAGRTDEALAAYQRALALMPYDGESYRRVGATLYTLGRVSDASAVYERWLALDPGNVVARHMVAACSGREVPARASDEFVERTFDAFAGSFDVVLERLQYRAPELVQQAVAAALGPAAATAGVLVVLDAGAGTGLCGPLLRGYARQLVGVDLSSAMLAKAKDRGTYDVLETVELTAYLRAHVAAFDLVVSADTLVYFGDLAEVLAAAFGALRAGGHLVFTVERARDDPPEGHRLNPHGRYSHAEGYLRAAVGAAGLSLLALERAHLRIENQAPVEGMVVTAARPASEAGAEAGVARRAEE